VDLHVKLIYDRVILDVSVQPIGFFHQNRPARFLVLFQVHQHLVELSSTAHLGCFNIGELRNHKTFARGVIAQKAKLGRDAEALLFLIFAGYPRIQYSSHRP
jgi:hypothetical protein